MRPREHPEWYGVTCSDTEAPKVPFLAKMTKMPLVNPGLTKGQTRSKSSQNNIFHGFISNLNSLEIFSNFDQVQLDRGHLKMAALQSPLPWKVCRGYKRPQAPPQTKKRRRRDSLGPALCLDEFLAFLLSSKHKKHIKASWFFSLPKIQGIVLIPNLLFLDSTPWIWGLGVWM